MDTSTFNVRWIESGQVRIIEEIRQASSVASLRNEIESAGGRILSVDLISAKRNRTEKNVLRSVDVAWWCKELATLLRAGMTVIEGIETLQIQSDDGPRANAQHLLFKALHEGKSLSKAMKQSELFPQVLIASVTASEKTSTLADALDDYLIYDSQVQALRKQAVGAAIYPLIVMVFGFAITLFLLLFVLPRFAKMYGTFHGAVSGPTAWMLWVSNKLNGAFPTIAIAIIGLILVVVYTWKLRWHGEVFLYIAENMPGIRQATNDFRSSQLYQSLALTLRGGFPLLDAMQICESLGLGKKITQSLKKAIPAIQRGQAASQAFVEAKLADPVAERLLRVGERTGQFHEVLQTLADRHSQAFAIFVQRATRLIEPLLLLVVALMVGGIVVMMYMPIFDIANNMR